MREVMLTANKSWFDGDCGSFFVEGENTNARAEFERYAAAWLRENFGNDVTHAPQGPGHAR